MSCPGQAVDTWACKGRCLQVSWPYPVCRKWETLGFQPCPLSAFMASCCKSGLLPPPWRQDVGSAVTHPAPSMGMPWPHVLLLHSQHLCLAIRSHKRLTSLRTSQKGTPLLLDYEFASSELLHSAKCVTPVSGHLLSRDLCCPLSWDPAHTSFLKSHPYMLSVVTQVTSIGRPASLAWHWEDVPV